MLCSVVKMFSLSHVCVCVCVCVCVRVYVWHDDRGIWVCFYYVPTWMCRGYLGRVLSWWLVLYCLLSRMEVLIWTVLFVRSTEIMGDLESVRLVSCNYFIVKIITFDGCRRWISKPCDLVWREWVNVAVFEFSFVCSLAWIDRSWIWVVWLWFN